MLSKVKKFTSKQTTQRQQKFIKSSKNANLSLNHRPVCHNCSRTGHISRNCFTYKKICRKCDKKGHIEKYCKSDIPINRRDTSEESYTIYQNNRSENIKWSDLNALKSFLWTNQNPMPIPITQMRVIPSNPQQFQPYVSQNQVNYQI